MANEKPNLLIIHTDQQSWWSLSCYGGIVQTPNIDRLAEQGARFTNFFTESAVCTPSRGCLLTGRYPHSHGACQNNLPLNRDEVTFAQVLKDKGYKTGYAGKWHLDGTPRPGWVHPERTMGFDHARYMFNRGHWKKIQDFPTDIDEPWVFPYTEIGDEETYTTDWLTEKTLAFIEDSTNEPFCFMLSIPDPHGPVDVRSPYDTMFKPEEMPLPRTFNNDEHLPDWAEKKQEKSPFGPHNGDAETKLRRFLALYCGEVKLIDDSVGRILECLEKHNLLNNTLTIFTTDHGEYAGEHGLADKNLFYETAYRIPLVMHWPDGIAPGTTVENLVGSVDFQPTVLSLMGVSNCGREQGRDGSELLQQNQSEANWDDRVFIHHSTHNAAGIFTRDFELALMRDGDSVLFDRKNDPDQTRNLFKDPAYQDVRKDLTQRVIQHHEEVNSPALEWLHETE